MLPGQSRPAPKRKAPSDSEDDNEDGIDADIVEIDAGNEDTG
jgi:hypothetical protein